jgi:hypothetical protein
MGIGKILDAVTTVGKTVDSLTLSKEEKANIDLEFNKLQTEINKIEAANESIFISGWRPALGWICAAGIGFNFVIRPLTNYFLIFAEIEPMPSLDLGELMPLVLGMLGFGAMRTYEKKNNVARGGLFRKKK